MNRSLQSWLIVIVFAVLGASACNKFQPKTGTVLDEAKRANRTPASLGPADEDFREMDGGIALSAEEKAATCGSFGPAGTIASGIGWLL